MVNVNDDNVIDWQKKSKKQKNIHHQRQRQGIKHQFTQKKKTKKKRSCVLLSSKTKKTNFVYIIWKGYKILMSFSIAAALTSID